LLPARKTLTEYSDRHPETKASIAHWYAVAAASHWASPLEAAAPFSKAKILNGERVRYEIAGGNYRLIVAYKWSAQIGFVKFIGTHKEYDDIDPFSVE
jgi:mRNA interferase HigB